MKSFYLTLVIMAISTLSFAEGTLQLITCATCEAGMSINDKAQFAYPGLSQDRRLHIRVGDFSQEEIYVALGQTEVGGAWYSRLVSPSGTQYVYDGTGFVVGGTPATLPAAITSRTENSAGPNGVTQAGAGSPTTGSYNSTAFTPNENGDWYIEFTDDAGFGTPTVSSRVPFWDITVVDNSSAANNVINGRLWSEQWGLRSGPGSQTDPGDFLASTFYVYTEPEQVVTAIEVGDENDPGWGGDWLIACNRYGIDDVAYNAGNAATARQSYDGDADLDYGPLSEYKIFVNDPDIIEFPSGIQEIEVTTIAVDLCDDGSSFITFTTNVQSVGDIILDFPPYNNNGAEDITFIAQVINAGPNTIAWNGFDNQGNAVAPGTSFFVRLFAGASTVHFPMYDIEGVTGLRARLVRPGAPGYIGLYWDNSQVPLGNGGNPITETVDPGCVSSASSACNIYGNSNEISLNIWWNGLETNIQDEVIVPTPAGGSVTAGNAEAICDVDDETVIVPLNGTAIGVNVIEWSSDGTGTFDNANIMNAIYTPSAADILTGTVLLTFSGFACPDVSDAVLVDIDERLCFLPIRLSEFYGTMVDPKDHCEGVKVAWTTAVEENTSHYVLERSSDGIKFELVGRVDALGNTSNAASYALIDDNIRTVNYYRLTAYDRDGSSESYLMESTVQTNCFEGIQPNTISDVFPNPVRANELVSIKLHVSEATNAMINITDIHGRTVRTIPTELNQGEGIIDFSLSGLDAGIYFVHLANGGWETGFAKLVKIQ